MVFVGDQISKFIFIIDGYATIPDVLISLHSADYNKFPVIVYQPSIVVGYTRFSWVLKVEVHLEIVWQLDTISYIAKSFQTSVYFLNDFEVPNISDINLTKTYEIAMYF